MQGIRHTEQLACAHKNKVVSTSSVHFYFHKKKIPAYEKLIYLGFTTWVFVLLYVRDWPTLKGHFQGLRAGLFWDPAAAGTCPTPSKKPGS